MNYTNEDTQPLLNNGERWKARLGSRRLLLVIAILSVLLAIFCTSSIYYFVKYKELCHEQPADWQKLPSSDQLLQSFPLNAVAADASVCSTIGAYVLNTLGGNAMDAAVASMLCIGVCNAQSAGIGGGSFLMYYDSSSKSATAFNFRETAARAATYDMFNKLPLNSSTVGGLAIAVPGEIAGLSAAHSRFGRLRWQSVVTPVVELLRTGLRVAEPLAEALKFVFPMIPDKPIFRTLRNWMINPETNQLYKQGDLLKDETLASTLELIGQDPSSFYNGSLAEQIVDEITAAGGIITLEDMRNYQVSQPEVINASLSFANLRLFSLPPPCSGPVLAYIMKIIDGFRPTPKVKSSLEDYVTFLHRIVEAMKFGFAKRSALGDMAFVNVTELVANLTSDSFADEARSLITDDSTHGVSYYGPTFEWKKDSGTTHLSLVDTDGNAVAITSSINTGFGSLVRGAKTGIIYNNGMDDFSVPNRTNIYNLPPSPSNFIAPGKRPMSSMVPAILADQDGSVRIVTGGAGGTRITSAVAYTLARQLYLNESVKEATDAFRLHHQLVPNEISYNPDLDFIPKEVQTGLKEKGHKFNTTMAKSIVEAIDRAVSYGRGWLVSGDFRKPSHPDGN